MDWQLWLAFAAAALVVGLIAALRPNGGERAVDRSASIAGLGVPPEIRPQLLRRMRATRVGEIVGAVIGVAVGALLIPIGEAPTRTLAVQASVLVVGGAGGLIGGLIAGRAVPLSGPRVARASAVRVADYISPVERAGSLAAVVAALLIGACFLTFGPAVARPPVAACMAVTIVVWVASEVTARRIVDRRQPAETALQLAWDDALRASAIRRLATTTAVVSFYAVLTTVWAEAHVLLSANDASGLLLSVVLGVLVVIVAIRFALEPSEPSRYFRRRLWPDTVAYVADTVARA